MDDQRAEQPVQTSEPGQEDQPLTYEETPEIPMAGGQESVSSSPAAEPTYGAPVFPEAPPLGPRPLYPRRLSILGGIGNIVLFVVLFGVGMWLSSFLRQYLPTGIFPQLPRSQPTPVATAFPTPVKPADPYSGWQTYQVVSSATRQSMGISFKLPEDVLSPICDGTTCMSQGTYLPGGTRFTVAARGPGLALRDFRGRVISDVNGMEFTTEDTAVAGRAAVKFTGTFSGRTVAGYAFTRMHGYMIEVNDTLSLEINHFTPAGIAADFESDHGLFEKVVKSLMFEGYPPSAEKGAIIPTPPPDEFMPETPSEY